MGTVLTHSTADIELSIVGDIGIVKLGMGWRVLYPLEMIITLTITAPG